MPRLIHGFAVGLAIWGLVFFLLGYVRLLPSSPPVQGFKARLIAAIAPIPLTLNWLVREYRPATLVELGVSTFFGLYGAMIIASLAVMHVLVRRWSDPATGVSSTSQL